MTRPAQTTDPERARHLAYSIRKPAQAGSKTSSAVRRGSRTAKNLPRRGSGIGEAPLCRRRGDGLVELAGLSPRTDAGRRDAIAAFADSLIADDHWLVPAFDQSVTFEACHQLIKRSARPSDAIPGDDVPNHSSRFLVREDYAEGKEL